ncbi:hypothetical protein Tco_0349326 [Tanacetum coccineum]
MKFLFILLALGKSSPVGGLTALEHFCDGIRTTRCIEFMIFHLTNVRFDLGFDVDNEQRTRTSKSTRGQSSSSQEMVEDKVHNFGRFLCSINTDPFFRRQWENLFRINELVYRKLVREFFDTYEFRAGTCRNNPRNRRSEIGMGNTLRNALRVRNENMLLPFWPTIGDGTDIAKITRKRSKPDKHGHGNGKECTRAGRMLSRACPHHGFTELTQVDTFYNGLNENEQDSLNAAAGGNLLSKTTREALNIIENKSKVRYSRNRSNDSRMNATSSKTDERIDKLADQLSTLVEIVSKKVVTPALVKAVEESCVTCGGTHFWYNCPTTDNNQASVCATTGTYNQVNPPNRVSNQMAPPGFASVQNNGQNRFNQNHVGSRNTSLHTIDHEIGLEMRR